MTDNNNSTQEDSGSWLVLMNFIEVDDTARQEVMAEFYDPYDAENWVAEAVVPGLTFVQNSFEYLPEGLEEEVGVRAVPLSQVRGFLLIKRDRWERLQIEAAAEDQRLREGVEGNSNNPLIPTHPEDSSSEPIRFPNLPGAPALPAGFAE